VRPIVLALLGAVFLLSALPSFAWWNADWAYRTRIVINGAAAGITAPVSSMPILVRLHTGNYSFLDAKPDGSDVRFVAGDDKTPLKHHVEVWDSTNELALVWVQVPAVGPGTPPTEIWLYSGSEKAVSAEDVKGTWDPAQVAVYEFKAGESPPVDMSAAGNNASAFTAALSAQSLIGVGAKFSGSSKLTLPASPTLVFGPAGGFTYSVWIKIAGPQQSAVLFSQSEGAAPLVVGINGLRPYISSGKSTSVGSTDILVGQWHYLAVTAKDRLTLYLDGQEAGSSIAALSESKGPVEIGANFSGELDQLSLANVARSADWLRLAAKAQGESGPVVTVGQAETNNGGHTSYFAILMSAVTLDGWVIIGILMVMMVISFAVMIGKAIFVARTDRANQAFFTKFRRLSDDLTQLYQARSPAAGKNKSRAPGGEFSGASVYRIYHVAVDELTGRFQAYKERGQALTLSSQSIGAIKATIDAGLIKETHRLNSQMVLLTIAISGGPFLGLLGTVVGVMITFAAIAAAGDVNVNSIAPGIAAALVATVAGLGVAIPALFGYNYLASRIRNITTDMQVFADELITRFAENYST
jgi:biopolymer transport protein ExbB